MTRQRVATPAGPRPAPPRPEPHSTADPDLGSGGAGSGRLPAGIEAPRRADPAPPRTRTAPGPRATPGRGATGAGASTRVTGRCAPPRSAPGPLPAAKPADLGPLTGLGVALLLGAACVCGSLFDLLLVGGPAWGLAVVYIATCAFTATRVRSADWFSALVSPPLAFAAAVILLAMLMPNTFGPGLLGILATTFELLAAKAKALYLGTAVSAAVLLARRVRARRAGPPR